MQNLPDDATLEKYMYVLYMALVATRARAFGTDPQIAELMDALHNVPRLLLRWPEMDEAIVKGDLEQIEARFPEWRGRFTSILKNGAPARW